MIYICLYDSPKHGGGVEQVVKNLINNFSTEIKTKLVLICNDLNEEKEFYFNGIRCINLKTKRFIILDKFFILSRLLFSFKIYKFLRNYIKDGDLVNIQGIEYSLFVSIFRNKIKKNFKVIATIHGSFFESYNDYVVKKLPWKFFYLKIFFFFWKYYFFVLEKIETKNIDYFIFINEHYKLFYIENYNLCFKKTFTVYNGINLGEKYKKPIKESSTFNAIIIGSSVYGKGLDLAIETVRKLNKEGYILTLNIVGFSDFFNSYKKEDLESFINYIGRVKPDDVKKYIEENDFLLFPSRSEGFPLTVLESLQYGLPIIVSKVCKANEITGYSMFGYIADAYRVETFVDLCKEIMIKENYNKFIKNIGDADFSKFDWKNISSQYELIFNKVTNE